MGHLVSQLPLSQPAVSKHLGVLRSAGLVQSRIEAQRRLYRICPQPPDDLARWLDTYVSYWSYTSDRLEHHLGERRGT